MRHLKSLSNPSTAAEVQDFNELITKLQEDGVEVIWDQIKGNVSDRMFDEFGSLYRGREDDVFTGLINAGPYVGLPDLTVLQKQVQNESALGHPNDSSSSADAASANTPRPNSSSLFGNAPVDDADKESTQCNSCAIS